MDFIPAQESVIFQRVFRLYSKWLFKRSFKKIWIHQKYNPSVGDRTVYFLNHASWWDGLIPFLLNEYRFHQQGRAIMEHKQMQTYPFFKKLGAFSIIPESRSHTLASLRYAVQSMQRPNAALFIYPEGEIVPTGSAINFKQGIGWLYQQLPGVDFVPVGINIHTIRHHKPELHLWVDQPVSVDDELNSSTITSRFEEAMENILAQLRETSGFNDDVYEHFF